MEAIGAHDLDTQQHAYDEYEDSMENEDDVKYDDQNWNGNTLPELGVLHNEDLFPLEEDEAAMYELEEPRTIAGPGDTGVSRGFWRPHRLY